MGQARFFGQMNTPDYLPVGSIHNTRLLDPGPGKRYNDRVRQTCTKG
jgi:hypothetical protein